MHADRNKFPLVSEMRLIVDIYIITHGTNKPLDDVLYVAFNELISDETNKHLEMLSNKQNIFVFSRFIIFLWY